MADEAFRLTSPAFDDGDSIPARFTCDGEDVSPALGWEGAPDATAGFALIVDDPDADGFVHWVVYDMTGSQSGALPEGISASPDAPPQGTNQLGELGWTGPCPPSGTHRYRFTLFALSEMTELTEAPTAAEVRQAIDGAVLDEAVLEAAYGRAR